MVVWNNLGLEGSVKRWVNWRDRVQGKGTVWKGYRTRNRLSHRHKLRLTRKPRSKRTRLRMYIHWIILHTWKEDNWTKYSQIKNPCWPVGFSHLLFKLMNVCITPLCSSLSHISVIHVFCWSVYSFVPLIEFPFVFQRVLSFLLGLLEYTGHLT